VLALVFLITLLGGCTLPFEERAQDTSSTVVITLPVSDADGIGQSQLDGVLVLSDGCATIVTDDGEFLLVIAERFMSASWVGDVLAVTDDTGFTEFASGDEVSVGGSSAPGEPGRYNAPESCVHAQVWVADTISHL